MPSRPSSLAHQDGHDEREHQARGAETESALEVVRAQPADRVTEREQHQRNQQVAEQLDLSRSQRGTAMPVASTSSPATAP